jgi:IS5 family transposase
VLSRGLRIRQARLTGGWAISGTGYVVPQPFATGRSNIVSRFFWFVTGDPWYLRYKTTTVAPEPSVERVVGAVYSIGGRICTHMSLRVPPRDLVVRPWG